MTTRDTMTNQQWDSWVNGIDCPFCAPQEDETPFWIKVRALRVSTLYLDRDQAYRGHCQLVFDTRHVVGLESLVPDEYKAFMADVRIAARAVSAVCRPELMNYASLGNVVPHLHWHLVPRYKGDPRWGGPIYTTTREEMRRKSLSGAEYRDLVDAIREELTHVASS